MERGACTKLCVGPANARGPTGRRRERDLLRGCLSLPVASYPSPLKPHPVPPSLEPFLPPPPSSCNSPHPLFLSLSLQSLSPSKDPRSTVAAYFFIHPQSQHSFSAQLREFPCSCSCVLAGPLLCFFTSSCHRGVQPLQRQNLFTSSSQSVVGVPGGGKVCGFFY